MAFEHLVNAGPTEKVIEYNGQKETIYVRKMTAGEKLDLRRGQKGEVRNGESVMQLDLESIESANQKIVFYCVCDENGKRVFKNINEVHQTPSDLVEVLLAAVNEVLAGDVDPK